MTTIQRRALYHLLRLNWLNDPKLSVESWQVEDYHTLSLSDLFNRLKDFHISLDRSSFMTYANECDSPEDLTEHFIGDHQLAPPVEDHLYLIIFELWRRLLPEKPSLSILCHELDDKIECYDQGQIEDLTILQDAIAGFIQLLDQNVDEGIPPEKVFQLVSTYCANDIETFLYDFIAEQIDEENDSYVYELLEAFDLYLGKNKWFKLLRMRLLSSTQSKLTQALAEEIREEYLQDKDLEFHLEFLSLITYKESFDLFRQLIQETLPLITREEAFQDLLSITMDYFHLLNRKEQEHAIQILFEKHSKFSPEKMISMNDPDLMKFSQLFELSS